MALNLILVELVDYSALISTSLIDCATLTSTIQLLRFIKISYILLAVDIRGKRSTIHGISVLRSLIDTDLNNILLSWRVLCIQREIFSLVWLLSTTRWIIAVTWYIKKHILGLLVLVLNNFDMILIMIHILKGFKLLIDVS